MRWYGITFLAAFVYWYGSYAAPCFAQEPAPRAKKPVRSFRMGFTPWPSDLTHEAVEASYTFADTHADVIMHHFDNGVPWDAALSGAPFSQWLQDEWANRLAKTSSGQAIFLSITPLNFQRTGLALYTGETDGLALPEPWSGYRLNHPDVKQAFTQYARRAILYFQPHYVALGIETNILISNDPAQWEDYVDLHAHVYLELKREFPTLSMFPTIQYEHFRGIEEASKANVHLQAPRVANLMPYADVVTLSTYQFGRGHNRVHAKYFAPALAYGKPVAISESGSISHPVTIWGHSISAKPGDQKRFVSFLLAQARKHRFPFVINWVPIDFDPLLEHLTGDAHEIGKAWVHTGLAYPDGTPKPALRTWDRYFNRFEWAP